jgi:hypothetical protein
MLVAATTPQTVLSMADSRCFDEICFQVTDVERRSTVQNLAAKGAFYVVTVRTFSKALGRPQREGGAVASLIDTNQHRYWPIPTTMGPNERSLDALIEPGKSVLTRLVFDVPKSVRKPGLVVSHSYLLNPASIIIGDDQHFLHKPAMIQLSK